jgi:hypothetical protein
MEGEKKERNKSFKFPLLIHFQESQMKEFKTNNIDKTIFSVTHAKSTPPLKTQNKIPNISCVWILTQS